MSSEPPSSSLLTHFKNTQQIRFPVKLPSQNLRDSIIPIEYQPISSHIDSTELLIHKSKNKTAYNFAPTHKKSISDADISAIKNNITQFRIAAILIVNIKSLKQRGINAIRTDIRIQIHFTLFVFIICLSIRLD